ncbi:LOW QUALITY PROTEIN: uncharacterized protein QC763_0078370 [Podospora pseudopauciseta]|uniref:Uncharacterized protein n=1 Tax=Podospora pseudopauciseta TaxID=2093780 RepID=A0ABR0HB12_9PEZI|nr:LOW QUALITY PROTEIN: hypothetical protein QC763_0078370 [Podospora pseudopauciseta]
MFPARLASLFGFVLIAIAAAVQGVRLDVPRVEDFVRRWNVAATVIGDYVYIDGGEINQFENGTIDEAPVYQVNSTLSIDISTSWTTSDVSIRTIGKPNAPRNAPMIWTDKEGTGGFYSWGGVFSLGRSVTGSEMWKFSADGRGGGSWSPFQDFANPEAFKILLSLERGAYANTDDKGFLIGGSVWGWTYLDTQAIPGMVSFDMRTKEISNGTANDAGSNRSPLEKLIGARAHFIPANTGTKSHQGLILVLGGHRSYVDRQCSLEDSPGFDFRNLLFFDPETGERYWQIATGDILPYPRAHFCVTGFTVARVGYDVFIFGRRNEAQQSYYDDAYILSLPGFVWILVPTPPAGPRFFQSVFTIIFTMNPH